MSDINEMTLMGNIGSEPENRFIFRALTVKEYGLVARKVFVIIRNLSCTPDPQINLIEQLADTMHNFPVDLENKFLMDLTLSRLTELIAENPKLASHFSDYAQLPNAHTDLESDI